MPRVSTQLVHRETILKFNANHTAFYKEVSSHSTGQSPQRAVAPKEGQFSLELHTSAEILHTFYNKTKNV